jgi:tetratricopeptide (TPR) repeat protein
MQDRPEDALASFKMAVHLAPKHADSQYALAAALYMRQKYEDAALAYSDAVAVDPELNSGHQQITLIFRHYGQYAAADAAEKRCIVSAIAKNPFMKAGLTSQKTQSMKMKLPVGVCAEVGGNHICRTSDLCAMKCFGYLEGPESEHLNAVLLTSSFSEVARIFDSCIHKSIRED